MVGIGHFFVATHALLRQHIGIGAGDSRRSVFVMDVDHNMVFGIFGDSIMEPCGPLLVANVHECELDAADAGCVNVAKEADIGHQGLVDNEVLKKAVEDKEYKVLGIE